MTGSKRTKPEKPSDAQFAELLEQQDLQMRESGSTVRQEGMPGLDGSLTAGDPFEDLTPEMRARLEGAGRILSMLNRVSNETDPKPDTEIAGKPDLTRLGRFELRKVLGGGGFGIVYHAFDTKLLRECALKLPNLKSLASPSTQLRFMREARAAASLDHPNIVPVFDTGEEGGVSFIVSAYCKGPTLSHWLEERLTPVPVSLAAQLVACMSEAIGHAHRRGVIHRDLKPANVMLEPLEDYLEGEGPKGLVSDGSFNFVPRITDFGLAWMASEDSGVTRTGTVMGSASYMSPEQATGLKEIGAPADVYSLGVILYELLTGATPFSGDNPIAVMDQVRLQEPPSPRRSRLTLPKDLETICLKCLEKDPGKRYATGDELAHDLKRFLGGAPVVARRVSSIERAWRWCRTNAVVTSLTATIVTLLFVVTLISIRSTLAAKSAFKDSLLRRAETSTDIVGSRNEALDALRQLDELSASGSGDAQSRMRSAAIRNLVQHDLTTGDKWTVPDSTIPDIVPGNSGDVAAVLESSRVFIYDKANVPDGRFVKAMMTNFNSCEFSPDDNYLFVEASATHESLVVDLATTTKRKLFDELDSKYHVNGDRFTLAVADDSSMFACVSNVREQHLAWYRGFQMQCHCPFPLRLPFTGADLVSIFDLSSLENVANLECFTGKGFINGCSFHCDPERVLAWNEDTVFIADWRKDEIVKTYDIKRVTCVATNATANAIAFGSQDHAVRVVQGKGEPHLIWHEGQIRDLSFTDDGRFLLSTDTTGVVKVCELAILKTVLEGQVGAPYVSLHNDWIIGLHGRDVCQHRLEPSSVRRVLPGVEASRIAFSNNGLWLAIALDDSNILAQEMDQEAIELLPSTENARWVQFSADDKSLIGSSKAGIQRWPVTNAAAGQLKFGTPKLIHAGNVEFFDQSRDGSTLVHYCDKSIHVTRDGKLLHTVPCDEIYSLRVSPDGSHVAVKIGFDVEIYEVASGKMIKRLWSAHLENGISFSPDGTFLIVGDGRVCNFHSVKTWELAESVPLPESSVYAGNIAVGTNSPYWAVCDGNNRIRMFSGSTNTPCATIESRTPNPWICISSEGDKFCTVGSLMRIELWDMNAMAGELEKFSSLPPVFPAQE